MRKSIDGIVFSNAVRGERLTPLINSAFMNSPVASANKINIYIDAYPIIRSIYSDTYEVDVNDKISLTANLINLCGHYRAFFKYNYQTYATIYIVYGRNCAGINAKFVQHYNRGMVKRLTSPKHEIMDSIINTNGAILSKLCPYLPDIHFINTEFETGVVIGHLINNQPNNAHIPNIVISRDIYPLQLVGEYPNTFYIRPYKDVHGNDISSIIRPPYTLKDTMDFWNYYFATKNTSQNNVRIHPINLSAVMALAGLPERSIKAVMNTKTVINIIGRLNGANASQCAISSILENATTKISTEEASYRFHAIDIPFQDQCLYSTNVEANTLMLENKTNNDLVREIISKYFTSTPIDLQKI